jgi:hypothetical protein
MRSQSSVEFLSLIGLVIVFVVAVMLQGFNDTEITIALSAARIAVLNNVSTNPAFEFTSLNYSVNSNNTVFLYPKVYPSMNKALRFRILSEIRDVLMPTAQVSLDQECIQLTIRKYCVGI